MPTDHDTHLRALLAKREELDTQAKVEGVESDAARRLQISAGRRRQDHDDRRATLARELAHVEQQIAVTRASMAQGGECDISDRALVRWLELVEGVDLQAIRERIRGAIQSSRGSRSGDFFVHETHGVRVMVSVQGKAVTVTPASAEAQPRYPRRPAAASKPR